MTTFQTWPFTIQWSRPQASEKTAPHFTIRSGLKTVLMHLDQLYVGKNHYFGEIGFYLLILMISKVPIYSQLNLSNLTT